ncbi:histidine kinase [Halalkalibacillus sediminis]|uniref:Oxygen sensor histidine kinase NreB n=1 Tax=Halalkalibacillus sediminis TaxID=2018042 RepID=A0A2I0QTB2_9BACI|nr:GAF domain-containing sensor histidine kinase [Halalkalibacillus sediminis]PKR77582.1 histidine kinase [Halalkalibacillus sediminis]
MDRNEELYLIKSIAEMLNRETSMKSMLQQVLNQVLELTNLHTGWIFLFDEQAGFELAAFSNLPPALDYQDRKYMCDGKCRCINRYQSGMLKKATNIINCERIEKAINEKRGETEGITHHASIPIQSGDTIYGLLNVASPYKENFNEDELYILELIALQIGTACERIRLSEHEQSMHILEERNRLARDLHDSVNQHLFSIMYTAKGTTKATENEEVLSSLEEIYQSSKESLAEMKDLIWQLRTDNIEEGLSNRFENYAKRLRIPITCEIRVQDLPSNVETTFWKIGQEALNNISKHSDATETNVIIDQSDRNSYTLEVIDNGRGFDLNEVSGQGMGLTSMQERAKLVGGECRITSINKKGTTVSVEIPMKEGKANE